MAKEKDKTLTTRFDSQTMAELNVSVEILGHRSLNALVHQLVTGKIREAKKLIPEDEFTRRVEAQKKESLEYSRTKSRERLEILGELLPRSDKGIQVLPDARVEKKKAG